MMQENAAKKARRIVIGRTLGGRTTFKTLFDCLKLHLPTPLVSIALITRGYFEILFKDKEGAKATRCRNPTLAKCEDETHTPKVGDLESSGTPESLELDRKGQNTSPWGVLGVIEKVLKCRCPKWPRIGHLDICSPSYGQKKGRESNWQFDSRPLKVGNRTLPDIRI